jgi:hypothetical protein
MNRTFIVRSREDIVFAGFATGDGLPDIFGWLLVKMLDYAAIIIITSKG